MSDADRVKWDPRYASGELPRRVHPSELLDQWLEKLGPGDGRPALDLACGSGRNSIRLAEAGYSVDAVDIAPTALERGKAEAEAAGLTINWIEQDLDNGPLPRDEYAVIMVARFHARNTVPWLIDALMPNGYLFYEQHFVTDHAVGGPRNRDFRLRPNELLRAFSQLRILFYQERVRPDQDGTLMAIAEMVACNGDGDLI